MLALRTEAAPSEEALTSFDFAGVQSELDLWENLSFSFDMDKDRSNPSGHAPHTTTRSHRTRSASTSSAAPSNSRPQSSMVSPPSRDRAHRARAHTKLQGPPPVPHMPGPGAQGPPNMQLPPGTPVEGYEALARALSALQEAYMYLPVQSGFPSANVPNDPNRYPPQIPPSLYAQFPSLLHAAGAQQQQQQQQQHPQQQVPMPQQFHAPPFPFAFPQDGQSLPSLQPLPSLPPLPQAPLPRINTQQQQQPVASTSRATRSASSHGSPDAGSPVDPELGMSEEKRRRNTAASGKPSPSPAPMPAPLPA